MTELKPCPFCGGEAEYSSTIDEDWGYVSHFVTCKNNCLDGLYSMGNTKKQAIEAWNNRSSPWNTGTPTEEGWYAVYYWDDHNSFLYDGFLSPDGEGNWIDRDGERRFIDDDIVRWQKMEKYKE